MTTRNISTLGLCLLFATACQSTNLGKGTTSPDATAACTDKGETPNSGSCAWARGRTVRFRVLTLSETTPWADAEYPRTDTPTFVLYDDGLVIFVKGKGEDAEVLQGHLDRAEVDALLRQAHDKLADVPEQITASKASDQPTVQIQIATQGPTRDIFAIGVDRHGKPTSTIGDPVPAGFAALYASLRTYSLQGATPWVPDELAVRLFRVTDGRSPVGTWPDELPLPPRGATEPPRLEHPNGRTSYAQPISYHIDGALEDSVTTALADLGEVPLVAWGGQTWIIRTNRVVPG